MCQVYQVIVKSNTKNSIILEKYFNTIDEINVYIKRFIVPIENDSWLERYFKSIDRPFNQSSLEDFIDSHRVALNIHALSIDYGDMVTCCGSKDEVVEVNGKSYRFGYNYGH